MTRIAPVLLMIAALGCDCEGPGVQTLVSDLVMAPGLIVLDDTYVGVESAREVRVENRGDVAATVAFEVEGEGYGVDGDEISVAANGTAAIVVRLFPLRAETFAGVLTVRGETLHFADTPTVASDQTLTFDLTGIVRTAPECDDGNACTDNVFDLEQETCTTTNHNRACGDDNACIEGGQCANGSCVGTPLVCAATAECRVAFCDPVTGCAEEEIAGACDDGDPCTTDFCGETECEHELAPDFTPCGPTIQCVSADVCQAGACTTIQIPNGIQCNDGNFCTDAVCADGECVGELVLGDPELLSQSLHFGGTRSSVIERPNNRLLVFDQPVHDGTTPQGGWLTELSPANAASLLVGPRIPFSPDGVAVTHIVGGGLSRWFGVGTWPTVTDVFRKEIDGTYVSKPLQERMGLTVFRGDVAYTCPNARSVAMIDLTGSPPLSAVELPGTPDGFICSAVALDTNTATLVVRITDGSNNRLHLYDIAAPLAPVLRDALVVEGGGGIATRDGRVVYTENSFNADTRVVVFPTFTPGLQTVFLPPEAPQALTTPGHPALISGDVYVRWSPENNSPQGILYRRTTIGNGAWEVVEEGRVRSRTSPAVVSGAGYLALAPHFLSEGSLFLLGTTAAVRPLSQPDVPHGSQGMLVPLPIGLASITADRVTEVSTTFNPDAYLLRPMTTLPLFNEDLMTLVRTGIGERAIGPVRKNRRYPPRNLDFETSVTRVDISQEQGGIYSAAVTNRPGPVRPGVFDEDAELAVGGAVTPETLLMAYAIAEGSGPVVLQIYQVSDIPSDPLEPWPLYSEISLGEVTRQLPASPLIVAAKDNRVAVYVAANASPLYLVDMTSTAFPSVRAQKLFAPPYAEPDCTTDVSVHDDVILTLCPNRTSTYAYAPTETVNLTRTNTWDVALGPVLEFDGELIVVANETSLDYLTLESGLAVVHSLELGEQPVDIARVGERAVVTTDHGIAVISPPCPSE